MSVSANPELAATLSLSPGTGLLHHPAQWLTQCESLLSFLSHQALPKYSLNRSEMLRSRQGWRQRFTPAIPALGKLRQQDFHEMGTNLSYTLNSRPGCRSSQDEVWDPV